MERGWKEYPYLHHVQLSDTETKNVFYDKLTFVYLELPRFDKTEDELETLLDKWMYVFKNLAKLDDRPKALRERVFRRLFRIAEIEQLDERERLVYRESQKHYWDYMNTIQSAEKTAAEQVAKEKDAVIREKEETILKKEEAIREKDETILKNEETIREKDEAILKKEEAIRKDKETIREKEETILEQEGTIRELLKNAEVIAVNLLKTGVSPETVSTSTGLDIRKVNEIFESLNH
jgi:alpha-galactosidase/6-phospho-beta-glucosidase family protein